jgi:hypothetical protein
MATYDISLGGNLSSVSAYPTGYTGTTNNPVGGPPGYAEHQADRGYAITRHIDTRPHRPIGPTGMQQGLRDFLKNTTLAVGDVLRLSTLLPGSRLTGVSYCVEKALTGFTFDLRIQNAAIAVATVNAGTLLVNADGLAKPVHVPIAPATGGITIDDKDYLTLTIVALPVGGLVPATGPNGLDFWATAHVFNFNNGNVGN